MKNKKRLIFKIIIIVIVLLLIYKAYDLMKTEEMYVQEKITAQLDVSQNEIITSGQETIIKTFDKIVGLKWLSNEELFVEGNIDGVLGQYVFDIKKQVLQVYKNDVTDHKPYGETFIDRVSDNSVLVIEDHALILKTGQNKKVIAGPEIFADKGYYQLSENKSKLLFYNESKNSLVTYNFKKDFYRTVYSNVPAPIVNDFYQLVKISPLGGYVSVESKGEDALEEGFSLYGADSGKVFAKNVQGVDLAWSLDDQYLTYYYTKESELLNVQSNSFKSRRMAYYDVSEKEIMFIDSTNTDYEMISEMSWYEDQVMVLIGDVKEDLKVNGLLIYDFALGSFKEVPLVLEALSLETTFDFILTDPILFITIDGPLDHNIVKINLLTHEYDVLENLSNFDIEDKGKAFYYHNQNNMLTFDDEKLTLSHGQREGYAYIEQDVFKVYPNPDLKKIAVLIPGKNIIKLLEID